MSLCAPAAEILAWTARQAHPAGMLPEQLHPLGQGTVSVSPLSWSHAEFVIAVRDYLDKRRQLQEVPS